VARPRAKVALSISTRISGAADTLPTYRGFVIAMEEAAARQDLPVELVWQMYDDAGDTVRTVALAEDMIADPEVVAVVGPMGSTEAFANSPLFDRAGLLQVSPCSSHPDLCQRGYRTFFRLVANEDVQGQELARVARSYLHASRIAVVHDSDAFGTVVADRICKGFEALGGTVVDRIVFDVKDLDPAAVAAQIQASTAEVFVFGVHAHEGRLVSAAARDAGVRAPFLGTDGMKTSFFLGGGDGRGEALHTHTGADFRRLASAADFRERYVARFPEDSTYSPEAYDAAMLVVEAIVRAGRPDRAAVLEAFRSIGTYDGITGPISFSPTGEREGAFASLYRVTSDGADRTMSYLGTTTELLAGTDTER
jgi:branched-chain amino acid transport system substrate-binding protein